MLALGRDEHVLRFEIAVDEALVVKRADRAAQLAEQCECAIERERTACDRRGEGLAFEPLHREVRAAVG